MESPAMARKRRSTIIWVIALAFVGLAGARSGAKADGPGTFQIHLLDALYNLSPEDLAKGCRIREEHHA